MKKTLTIIISTLATLIVAGLVTYFCLPFILAKNVRTMTGTPVSVGSISLRPETLTISDFVIYNPKEASSDVALSVDYCLIEDPFGGYIGDDSEIESVDLENIYVNIELYNKERTKGNWQTIMESVEKASSKVPAQSSKMRIRQLTLHHINIELTLFDSPMKTFHIPRLVFYNLPLDDGLPAKKIVNAVVKQIIPSIFLEAGVKFIFNAPGNIIKGALSPLIAPFKSSSYEESIRGDSD